MIRPAGVVVPGGRAGNRGLTHQVAPSLTQQLQTRSTLDYMDVEGKMAHSAGKSTTEPTPPKRDDPKDSSEADG